VPRPTTSGSVIGGLGDDPLVRVVGVAHNHAVDHIECVAFDDADDMTFGEIVERLHEEEWDVDTPDVTEAHHA